MAITTLADGQELILPIHRLRGHSDGPTLGLVALLHGDETLPNEMVRRILSEVPTRQLSGSILAIPAAHGSALEFSTRNSPLDMLDLNRSFPGDPAGWVTEQLANGIAEHFLSEVDYLIDIHSGGLFPTVEYVYMVEGAEELGLALGCKYTYLARNPHPGGLAALARSRSIPAALLELGGGLVADEALIESGVDAIANVLRHYKLIEGVSQEPAERIVFEEMSWLRPRVGGILYPEVGIERLGGVVTEGELLGRVVNPMTYEVLEELRSPFACGYLVLLRASLGKVNPGDFAYMIGNADSSVSAQA